MILQEDWWDKNIFAKKDLITLTMGTKQVEIEAENDYTEFDEHPLATKAKAEFFVAENLVEAIQLCQQENKRNSFFFNNSIGKMLLYSICIYLVEF